MKKNTRNLPQPTSTTPSSMKKLIIVKLGGSVITDKDSQKPKAHLEVIKRLSEELSQIYQDKYQLIVVHGAGSYAHPLVKKYGLNFGVKTKGQREALLKVHRQLTELNNLILEALVKNHVPVTSFPPRTFIEQRGGKLFDFDFFQIEQALKKNLVPVLFGDMVKDPILGYSVLSGDTIVAYLANKLQATRVIFLCDVDGIYTADPKVNPTAKLIPEINDRNFNQIIKGLTSTKRQDVTGEMKGKLISLRRSLKGLPVMVVNGLKSQTLQKALMQASIGTKLLLS